jgi:hypothetical protein
VKENRRAADEHPAGRRHIRKCRCSPVEPECSGCALDIRSVRSTIRLSERVVVCCPLSGRGRFCRDLGWLSFDSSLIEFGVNDV